MELFILANTLRSVRLSFWVFLAVVTVASAQPATVLLVDDDAGPGGDGLTWPTAFDTLQGALDVASDPNDWPCEIRIAGGVYRPTWLATPTDPTSATFRVVGSVALAGGYAGLAAPNQPDVCDPTFYGTLLSGDSLGNDVPTQFPYGASYDDNVGPVVSGDGSSSAASLMGLTIAFGRASYGGGVYDFDGAITNCTIQLNSAYWGGGLAACDGQITACRITYNRAAVAGGGVNACNGMIGGCTVMGNAAPAGGGLYTCGGLIVSCMVLGNRATTSDGGGFQNCDGTIVNCTVVRNSAAGTGYAIAWSDGMIRNCIIWANGEAGDGQVQHSVAPIFSCIEGWTGGGLGNIVSDPLFVDPDGIDGNPLSFVDNDYHITAASPCFNGGDPNASYDDQVDIDDQVRVAYSRADIGADEVIFSFDLDANGVIDLEDLSLFTAALGGPNALASDPAADLDGDDDCDLADFASFAQFYGAWH